MNSPHIITLRCEVLSYPKQVREILKTSERAVQVALDVQTEGPGAVGAILAGVSICFEPGTAYLPLLGADGLPKVMHDTKSGLMVLAQHGMKAGTPTFDTLLAAFLLDGKAYDLEDLVADRLGPPAEEEGVTIGSEERARHLCARADAVLRLGGLLEAELEERGQL